MTGFESYLRDIKDTITPIAKLDFLTPDGKGVAFEVTDDFVADGTLNVNFQNGVRRTATVRLNNWDRLYDININKLYFGQQIKLYAGILLRDGTEFMLPQGVFYISNPEEVFEPSNRTITLNLVDKWGYLDGTIFGKLDGIYQLNVNDNLLTAVQQLLLKDRGNGIPLDSTPPMFDSYFATKTVNVGGTDIPISNAPYTMRIDATGCFADVLLEIATMLVASIGYDVNGQLRIESAQADAKDFLRPSLWEFSLDEKEFLGANFTHNMTEMYNDVKVIGAVLNGSQIYGRATNKNPTSDCNVERIGYKTYTITESKYYFYDMCNERAKYELKKRTAVQKSASFNSSLLFHLRENCIVTLLRPMISSLPEKFLITGYTLPIGGLGTMNIDGVLVREIDVYDKWLRKHNIEVLCQKIGALKISYIDGVDTITANIKNPYTIEGVPAGVNVQFSVETNPESENFGYTIHSVKLNDEYITHTGVSCSFVMPDYDSNVVFSLSPVAGQDVVYTYSGTHTSEDRVIGGIKYKLITITSSGDLAFSQEQINRGIVGDVWVRGAGGGGNSIGYGGNGYDDSIYGEALINTSITIGVGGAAGITTGVSGNKTSFGDKLSGAGGVGTSKLEDGSAETFAKVFGYIEDSTNGAGGGQNASGTNGVCYIRIALKDI